MKLKLTYLFALLAVAVLWAPASAQFTITIPKIPKFPKIEKSQPRTDPTPAATSEPDSSPTSTPATPETSTRPVAKAASNCSGGFTEVHTENMEKTRKEADEYRPGLRNYYVQDFNDNQNEYLWAAISPHRRKEWLKKLSPEDLPCFVPLFDAIAAAAKKTLPTYHPTAYTVRDPVGEKLLRANIPDLSEATVFKVAFKPGPWIIGKDSYNFPTNRFKYGVVWAKWASNDHGYCQIYYINLVQDYAGGGTYGGSYANYVGREPAGCPAGK